MINDVTKKVLVVVDCQNDFIDGTLGVGYDKWMKAWKRIDEELNKDYDHIVFTQDYHPLNHCSFKKYGGQWEPHCVQETFGSQLYWKLEDLIDSKNGKDYIIIQKGKQADKEQYGIDIYYNLRLNNYEKFGGYNYEFYFCGIALDYCVSACAKLTDEHDRCICYIIKDGCCSINDDATPDTGNAIII